MNVFAFSVFQFRCFVFRSRTQVEPFCHRNCCRRRHFATLHQYIQLNCVNNNSNPLPYFHFKLNSLPECSHFAWQRTLTIAQSVTHPHSGTPIRFQNNFNWEQHREKNKHATNMFTHTSDFNQQNYAHPRRTLPHRSCSYLTGNSIRSIHREKNGTFLQ